MKYEKNGDSFVEVIPEKRTGRSLDDLKERKDSLKQEMKMIDDQIQDLRVRKATLSTEVDQIDLLIKQ